MFNLLPNYAGICDAKGGYNVTRDSFLASTMVVDDIIMMNCYYFGSTHVFLLPSENYPSSRVSHIIPKAFASIKPNTCELHEFCDLSPMKTTHGNSRNVLVRIRSLLWLSGRLLRYAEYYGILMALRLKDRQPYRVD